MPLITRAVTNSGSPLYSPSGTLLSNIPISFVLVDSIGNVTSAFDVVTGERISGTVNTTTDNAGVFTVNLWPNDRGDKATKYSCRVQGLQEFSAQVPSGALALSWLMFKTESQLLTPAQVTQLNQHIADATVHLTPTQNTLIDTFSSYLSSTEFSYLDGITSSVQGQINAITASNVFSVNGYSGVVSLSPVDIGLGSVNNTSDINKPISTLVQSALDLKSTKASPIFTGDVRSTLLGTENFVIDATDPRTMTLGVFRIDHRAGIEGSRPITLNIDSNGFGNTRAMVINYLANGIGPNHESHLHEIIVDTDGSTGGKLQAMTVSKGGTGLVEVTAVEALPGVNVLTQKIGDPAIITQAWTLSGSTYTDTTLDFSNGTNIELFTLDNDYIICGYDSVFNQLDVDLITNASNTILSIFEYSTGNGTWATFTPSDGTNGFTKSGTIMWPSLAGWVTSDVNGVSKFYIRIQRTRNTLTIRPVEHYIKIVATVDYGWDKNADISIRKLKASGFPVFADRAAAQTGGLSTNDVYQTSTGVMMIV